MTVGLPEGPSYPGHLPHTNHFFAVQPPERPQKGSTQLLRNLSPVFYLLLPFSCPSSHSSPLLMNGNVHSNPCPVFPCSVCAGNVTWRGRSVQRSTCSKWIYLKCSLNSFSRFRTLGSSHSWSFPRCCIPAFSGDPTPTSTVTSSSDSSSLYISTAQSGLSCSPLLMQHFRRTLAFKALTLFSAHFVSSSSVSSPPPHAPGCFSLPPASSYPP